MNITIVVQTYNRFEYTKKCLARLLADPSEEFDLYLWDNASTDETPEYLKDGVKDPRIVEVVLSKENVGQTGAMNYAWSRTKAELVGKVDNDCLLTPGWTRIMAQAHYDIQQLGAIGCWHFSQEDFDEKTVRQRNKLQTFGVHQIFRHAWIGGSGFLMKRKTFVEMGPWEDGINVGTTKYYMKMALAGHINGWYYPLIFQEHMDDPFSKYTMQTNDEAIRQLYDITYTLRTKKIRTLEQSIRRRNLVDLPSILYGTYDPRCYVGWRSKLRVCKAKFIKLLGLDKKCYHRQMQRMVEKP